MKNLLVLLLTVILSFPVLSQEPDRELSDYEKYRMEKESETYLEEEICWNVVEEMPRFNGGEPAEFKKWIALNVEYPIQAREERIHGKVFVKFVVNKVGDVVNVEVTKSADPILDAEAIRVIKSSPKWYPGFQRGNPVNVEFTFPIKFVLKDDIPDGPAVVNNYYNYDYDYGYRHRMYFDTWYYRPYHHYSYYDPFYYNNYWGYNPYYYGGYYSYWGYNTYYNGYYRPHYNYGYYSQPRGNLYARSNTLGWNKNYYSPYKKTYRSGYVSNTSTKKSPYNAYTKSTVASKPTANINRKTEPVQRLNKNTYTPRYDKPRTGTKPSYNKPMRTTRVAPNNSRTRSIQQSTRSSYNQPSTSNSRSSSSYNRPSTSNSRSTYNRSRSSSSSYTKSSPARSSSNSYTRSSSPSRSSYSRSSSSSSGRSYSGGSTSRSSGSRSGGRK